MRLGFVGLYNRRVSKVSNFKLRSLDGHHDMKAFLIQSTEREDINLHNAARMECLKNIMISDDTTFGSRPRSFTICDHTHRLHTLPLDHYLMNKEIIRLIPDIYPIPDGRWENFYNSISHTDVVSFFSGPSYPWDAQITLGFPDWEENVEEEETDIKRT